MSLYIGANEIKKIYIGSAKIKQAYLGDKRVYINALPVTYNVDTSVTYTEEVEPGNTVLSPTTFTPTKSGYIFTGWREDNTASSTVLNIKVMGDTPITLYAVFQKSVTITKYNGSTTSSTESKNIYYNNGNNVDPTFTLTETDVSGWTKTGWTNSDSGYSATIADGGSVTLSANATYYSLYNQTITVTYYNNSTTASTTTGTRKVNYHSDATYSNPSFTLTCATVSGWTIRGWSTSNSASASITYNSGTTFTRDSNVTLYASWSKSITVTYYNNSTTASTASNNAYRNYAGTETGASFTLTCASVSNWSARGWSTTNTGNASISYSSGTAFTRTSDITLYSLYQRTVTITYNANSGSGTTAATTGTAYRNASGTTINASLTVANNGFTRSQYAFSTWAAGSASGTKYAPGSSYSSTSDVTMYAVWINYTYLKKFTIASTATSFTVKRG